MTLSIEILPSERPDPTLNEVMLVIISGFSDIAMHDKDQPIRNNRFPTIFQPYGETLDIRISWPPLLYPSWYTYGFMAMLLDRIAADYLSRLGSPGPRRLELL